MIKLILVFFVAAAAHAGETLEGVEANCWNSGADGDGTFLCLDVMIGAKLSGKWIYPELRAPDGGGDKTYEQANRACELLGFRYAVRFELATPRTELQQVYLEGQRRGFVEASAAPYIRHLNCTD